MEEKRRREDFRRTGWKREGFKGRGWKEKVYKGIELRKEGFKEYGEWMNKKRLIKMKNGEGEVLKEQDRVKKA